MSENAPGMTDHMREAIEINIDRRPRYAALSNGLSLPITDSMIAFERRSLLIARLIDRAARRHHKHGVMIASLDFIPMSETPDFQNSYLGELPKLEEFRPMRIRTGAWLLVRLVVSGLSGNFAKAYRLSTDAIDELGAEHRLNCMTRHFLESVARGAWLAPQYAEEARRKMRPEPKALSRALLCLQAMGLPWAIWMDHRAAPLQCRGLPIIYQDVPPIPYR